MLGVSTNVKDLKLLVCLCESEGHGMAKMIPRQVNKCVTQNFVFERSVLHQIEFARTFINSLTK